jgi:LacI family transcriptional regulator
VSVQQPRKISQAQIAHDLGLSQGLVSLVLNGRRHGIKPATYERIWQYAHSSGYRAKGMDPSAAVALPPQIGTLFSATQASDLSAHSSRILEGIHTSMSLAGGSSLSLGTVGDANVDQIVSIVPKAKFFQGLVIVGDSSPSLLEKLSTHEPRLVSVSPAVSDYGHHVGGDEAQSLGLLVQHLHTLGHRRIGWLGTQARLASHDIRLAAFHSALAQAGLARNARYETGGAYTDRAEGAEAIDSLLAFSERADFPTAFVAYNTLLAAGALLALRRAGWDVPRQMSIASADSSMSELAAEICLTHAGVCPYTVSRTAVSLLLKPNPITPAPQGHQRILLPAELTVGKTSGKVPTPKIRRRSATAA